ncbi:MAG TPA: HD domain-containing phosphohydrolase [Acidobacteriota bacterium]|jgi:putative nucleotidyltransferase with HDIG domain
MSSGDAEEVIEPAETEAQHPDSDEILVVDDEPLIRDSLVEFLSGEGFPCRQACTGSEALSMLQRQQFALVICDIQMPDLDGLQLLKKVSEKFPEVAFMMITGVADVNTAVMAMKQGACDYLTKPFNLDNVLPSVNRALTLRRMRIESRKNAETMEGFVRKRSQALQSALRELKEHRTMTLDALLKTLDARGHETHSHSLRVQEYTVLLAKQFGYKNSRLLEVAQGALLHDIGKIGVSDSILLKEGTLDDQERAIMKTHPVIGHQILQSVKFLEGASQMALYHHERYDGLGYPMGLKGDQIPLEARIFSVLDTFDAMTSDRPYRKRLPAEKAVEEIIRMSGTQFDPIVVQEFLKVPVEEWEKIRLKYM